jgi:deoxyribodipyrimidine photolyase
VQVLEDGRVQGEARRFVSHSFLFLLTLTSGKKRRFTTEGVYDLRDSLRERGSDLLIRFGKMEKVAEEVVKALQANGDEIKEVFLQEEVRLLLLPSQRVGLTDTP